MLNFNLYTTKTNICKSKEVVGENCTYKLFSEIVHTFAFELETAKKNTTPTAIDRSLKKNIDQLKFHLWLRK